MKGYAFSTAIVSNGKVTGDIVNRGIFPLAFLPDPVNQIPVAFFGDDGAAGSPKAPFLMINDLLHLDEYILSCGVDILGSMHDVSIVNEGIAYKGN